MAADNHTTIVGNLVDDPELRFTNADLRVAIGSPRICCLMSVNPFAGKLAGHYDRWNVGAISLPGPGCRSTSSGLAVRRRAFDPIGGVGGT